MKFKSKTGYLGEKISILPWQMAEQLAVEVDVKNVTDVWMEHGTHRTSSFIWLGLSKFVVLLNHLFVNPYLVVVFGRFF